MPTPTEPTPLRPRSTDPDVVRVVRQVRFMERFFEFVDERVSTGLSVQLWSRYAELLNQEYPDSPTDLAFAIIELEERITELQTRGMESGAPTGSRKEEGGVAGISRTPSRKAR